MSNALSLVSVVIPFFNPRMEFLRAAVESVQAQTYSAWEIVLVNDGSTDEEGCVTARQLAASMADRIRLVSYSTPGNRGASAARNEGLRYASGEYVSFLDADDVWLPHKLTLEVAELESHPNIGMVYSLYRYWYGWMGGEHAARDWIPRLGVEPRRRLPPPSFVKRFVQGHAAVPCPSSTTFRRSALEAVGGGENAFPGLYEDQVLYAKVGLRFEVMAIEELTALYRQHQSSICASSGSDSERRARRQFLFWLRTYISSEAVFETDLLQILEMEIWKTQHPRSARALRWLRKLTRDVS